MSTPKELKEFIEKLNDEDLFDVLEFVSDEVRRRNSMIGPDIGDIRSATTEENVTMIMEALGELGVRMRNNELLYLHLSTVTHQ